MAALRVRVGSPALDPSGIDVERIQAPAHGVIDDVHETVCSNSDKRRTPTPAISKKPSSRGGRPHFIGQSFA
jgi:hypothetical protein